MYRYFNIPLPEYSKTANSQSESSSLYVPAKYRGNYMDQKQNTCLIHKEHSTLKLLIK